MGPGLKGGLVGAAEIRGGLGQAADVAGIFQLLLLAVLLPISQQHVLNSLFQQLVSVTNLKPV